MSSSRVPNPSFTSADLESAGKEYSPKTSEFSQVLNFAPIAK
jgi:hypothetical protein